MNQVILIGRMTKDAEVKNTASQRSFCNFTLAVGRKYKDANGQRQTDFINCVAWGSTCGLIASHFKKGDSFGVIGELKSRSFDDNNGQRRYVTEVIVNHIEFISGNTTSKSKNADAPATPVDALEDLPDALDDTDLPFEL